MGCPDMRGSWPLMDGIASAPPTLIDSVDEHSSFMGSVADGDVSVTTTIPGDVPHQSLPETIEYVRDSSQGAMDTPPWQQRWLERARSPPPSPPPSPAILPVAEPEPATGQWLRRPGISSWQSGREELIRAGGLSRSCLLGHEWSLRSRHHAEPPHTQPCYQGALAFRWVRCL